MIRIHRIWNFLLLVMLIVSCTEVEISPTLPSKGLIINVSQGMDVSSQSIVDNMRLISFYSDTRLFDKEILNIERGENTLSCQVEEGKWHMLMVSAADNFDIVTGNGSTVADNLLLYEYNPLVVDGKSENATELFTSFVDVPQINADQNYTISSTIVRNVAKVELIVKDISGEIDLTSPLNKVYLHNVPSKISYTGYLLPNATEPDTLANPIYSVLNLHDTDGRVSADTITFLIPANKGDLEGEPIQHKMNVSIELKKTDGSMFTAIREIPLVAKCNEVLRVNLTVNTGVDIETSIHPWYDENYDESLDQTDLVVDKARVYLASKDSVYVKSNEPISLNTETTNSWLTVSLADSNKIDLRADVNSYSQPRTTSFIIESGRINKEIKVTQQPEENTIHFDNPRVIVSPANITRAVSITSEGPWEIRSTLSKVTADLLSGGPGVSTINFTRKGDEYHGDELCVIRNMESLEELHLAISSLYFTDPGVIEFGGNGGSQVLPIDCYGGQAYLLGSTSTPWLTVSNDVDKNIVVDALAAPDEAGDRTGSVTVRHVDDPDYTMDIEILQKENIIVTIPEFEYLTYRYYWTSADGRDLDTATEFTNTGLVDNNGVSLDHLAVGWSMDGNYNSTIKRYLKWGGDNTGSGNECTFIDMDALLSEENYPILPRFIEARIYATWYAARYDGNITFEIVAYKGGTMVQNGYNFVNQGGVEVYREVYPKYVPTIKGEATYETSYTYVCKVTYDKIKHSAQVEIIPDSRKSPLPYYESNDKGIKKE